MMKSDSDPLQDIVELAFTALQANDCQRARRLFDRLIARAEVNATVWLGQAHACARLGDIEASLSAVDHSLQLEPGNLRALLFKAERLQQQHADRQALEYYQRALALAANAAELPEDVRQGLQVAEQLCAEKEREYMAFLSARLQAQGYRPQPNTRRFQESLELIGGTKNVYYQRPRRYYFPGLPQIQFYQSECFGWVRELESKTAVISDELTQLMQQQEKFAPYLQADSNHLGRYDEGLLNSQDWSALYLWEHGRLADDIAALFPQTLRALESAPLPMIEGQAPMVLFSKLRANTRIPPHNGVLNTRLICHLPLIVPPHCGALRVGNEERAWVEGEMLIFDDSIEHEAWNHSDEERVVLLFEIWRPELNTEERELVSTLLTAVREYYNE